MPTPTDDGQILGQAHAPILFFDGVCGLCNGVVDWIFAHDQAALIRFAPLQGQAAARWLSQADRDDLDSVVYRSGEKLFRRSDAIIEILFALGGLWRILGILLRIIPRPVRDFGYRLVARTRYRLFGHSASCRIPSKEERSRFFD
jgi:predicted DCC family thiol-disulfide oxidoreductase YuxK